MKYKNNLMYFKEKTGLSFNKIGKAVGISQNYVQTYCKNDSNKSLIIVLRLAKLFNCRVEDLFELIEDEENENEN